MKSALRQRPPRWHPGWFFLLLWLAVTAVAVTLYLVEGVL